MSDMEEKFLNYDIPNFVKESPNYLKLFEKERIILKNKHDKWGIYFSKELGYSLEYKENLEKVDYIYMILSWKPTLKLIMVE